jgi:5,10-methylenetetrahydrofolate reductase
MPDSSRNDFLDILEAVSEAQLRTIRKLRGTPASSAEEAERSTKRMSQIDMVHYILSSVRRPLHIADILQAISKHFGVDLDRESVVSALAKRVARKDRFVRTGPNTFALLPER